jgi:hypothetical protein
LRRQKKEWKKKAAPGGARHSIAGTGALNDTILVPIAHRDVRFEMLSH